MTRQVKKKITFINIASEIANLSTCSRLQVGAIITDSNFRIIGMGYNGAPSHVDHCIDENKDGEKEKCNCIHAEQNAIINSSGKTNIYEKKKCFVTAFPCPSCLKLLASFNVKEIYFDKAYSYFNDSAKIAIQFNIKFDNKYNLGFK